MERDKEPWSSSGFDESAAVYEGPTQNARALSEAWIASYAFCPNCGAVQLARFPNNAPVADFFCATCHEEYELKATKGRIGHKLNDGAFETMKARLAARNNPSLMVMRYNQAKASVTDLLVVPKHFFTDSIIEPRAPLSPTARRAGWRGCNILLGLVPEAGRIALIRDGLEVPKADVLAQWRSTAFLSDSSLSARGWLLAVMRAVEAIGRREFTLNDVYAQEAALAAQYPGNNNVRPKIRQQLQVLRDRGWLAFSGRGSYRLVSHS